MYLYIKQKTFSWVDSFTVKNEQGEDVYQVKSKFFSLGKKFFIYEGENLVALVKEVPFNFLPQFYVFRGDEKVAEIQKKISFLREKYYVETLDWEIQGDPSSHDYLIYKGDTRVAKINKKWMTWGDTYEVIISGSGDPVVVLAVILAIDCVASK